MARRLEREAVGSATDDRRSAARGWFSSNCFCRFRTNIERPTSNTEWGHARASDMVAVASPVSSLVVPTSTLDVERSMFDVHVLCLREQRNQRPTRLFGGRHVPKVTPPRMFVRPDVLRHSDALRHSTEPLSLNTWPPAPWWFPPNESLPPFQISKATPVLSQTVISSGSRCSDILPERATPIHPPVPAVL